MKTKIIKEDNVCLAYLPDSMRFFEVNEKTAGVIQAIENSYSKEEIMTMFDVSENDINKVNSLLQSGSKIPEKSQEQVNKEEFEGLEKLVLNISNSCNLRCKYCYANGGSYQSDENMMEVSVAKKALDVFFNKFEVIHMIQIFGGEPTMNMPLIHYICEYIAEKNENKEIKTRIGIVTNGTMIGEDFIQLVNRYQMQVTVSFDGVPLVNDMMRVYENGLGTSEVILKNIRKLKENTDQPSTIEVTYNENHIKNDVHIADIIQYIRSEFGEIPLHIVPAGGEQTCDFVLKNRDEFIQSVDDVFENPKKMNTYTYSLVQRVVNAFYTKRSSKYICAAGLAEYSISTLGEVYPCFMFTDDESLCIGSIFDEHLFESENFVKTVTRLENFNKTTIPECKECFIRRSCTGCLGINLLETKDVFTNSEVSCDMYRKMTERVIINLYKISKKECECDKSA